MLRFTEFQRARKFILGGDTVEVVRNAFVMVAAASNWTASSSCDGDVTSPLEKPMVRVLHPASGSGYVSKVSGPNPSAPMGRGVTAPSERRASPMRARRLRVNRDFLGTHIRCLTPRGKTVYQ